MVEKEGRELVVEEPCVAVVLPIFHEKTDEERFDEFTKQDEENIERLKRRKHKESESNFPHNFALLFSKVSGKDEVLDAFELRTVMEMIYAKDYEGSKDSFSLETCRCFIASVDKNRNGSLTYYQFKRLWVEMMKWKNIFERNDKNKDRMIDKNELQNAVKELGYELADATIDLLLNRYGNRKGILNLDDFCGVCSKIKTLADSYEILDKNNDFSYDQYLLHCLYS